MGHHAANGWARPVPGEASIVQEREGEFGTTGIPACCARATAGVQAGLLATWLDSGINAVVPESRQQMRSAPVAAAPQHSGPLQV